MFCTVASQESEPVERELELAVRYRKEIIPVELEDVELSSSMIYYLANRQIIRINPDDSDDRALESVYYIHLRLCYGR